MIELKNIIMTRTSDSNGIYRVVFELRNVPVLRDVLVIFLSSFVVLSANWQFLSCASIPFSERYAQRSSCFVFSRENHCNRRLNFLSVEVTHFKGPEMGQGRQYSNFLCAGRVWVETVVVTRVQNGPGAHPYCYSVGTASLS
jgi:hypothetical protein